MRSRLDNHRHNVSVFRFCLTVHSPMCIISFVSSFLHFSPPSSILPIRDNNAHGYEPPPTFRVAELVHMTQFDNHVWPDSDCERVLKAKAVTMNLQYSASSMRLTLLNRQLPKGRVDRRVLVLLRAEYAGKRQWVGDVRVRYAGANGSCIGYGKCCGFFLWTTMGSSVLASSGTVPGGLKWPAC